MISSNGLIEVTCAGVLGSKPFSLGSQVLPVQKGDARVIHKAEYKIEDQIERSYLLLEGIFMILSVYVMKTTKQHPWCNFRTQRAVDELEFLGEADVLRLGPNRQR